MDKSKKYLALCSRADEIQRRWVRRYGDFYQDETGRISCWIDTQTPQKRFKKGFVVRPEGGVIRLSKHVWLPRQDQLIEMAQVKGRTYDRVVLDFFNWTKSPYDRDSRLPGKLFASMEQIWLAYIMHRKFLKKWDETAWKRIL